MVFGSTFGSVNGDYLPVKQSDDICEDEEEILYSYDMEYDMTQELVSKGRRKWTPKKLMLIAGVAVAMVAAVTIAAVVLSSNSSSGSPSPGEPLRSTLDLPSLSLEDCVSGILSPRSFNGTWISGTSFSYEDMDINVVEYDVESGNTKILVPKDVLANLHVFSTEVSPSREFVLLAYDYQKVFRHNYMAKYSIYNIETGAVTELSPVTLPVQQHVQLVQWAPQGNGIAYVVANDVYYRPKADSDTEFRLTDTGVMGIVYNGIPDWVYEEEVLSPATGMWFSTEGSRIAIGSFNDTPVKDMEYSMYGEPSSLQNQYPVTVQLRYPKPGSPNPVVSIQVVELATLTKQSGVRRLVEPPIDEISQDHIFSAVTWSSDTEFCVVWMNRVQNKAVISVYDESATRTDIVTLSETKGWVNIFSAPMFSSDLQQLLLILPQDQGGDSGNFKHLTLIDRATGSQQPLTSGKNVVSAILKWDKDNGKIYYMASEENYPSRSQLYSISDKGPAQQECLTCGGQNGAGESCSYFSIRFSTDNSHYVQTCNGLGVPEVVIKKQNGTTIRVWESNDELRTVLSGVLIPTVRDLRVPLPGGFNASVRLLLPPNIDTSGETKYPLFINVYAGPDSQRVLDRFAIDWGTFLVTNRSVIYGFIDGRASGMQGDNLLFSNYRALGTSEIEDQINVTKYLQQNLPYVDATRTGIWGWSYGGYSTLMSLIKDTTNVFKCGISVAPVTNWIYYDSIYTERYMGLPTLDDNVMGYDGADAISKVEGLRGKKYYLIHGTGDDNVHYQQSLALSRELELKDIMFRQQSYTDEDHGLVSVKNHLYHSLQAFLDECFE